MIKLLVAKRPVSSFFLLAFLITWALWIPLLLLEKKIILFSLPPWVRELGIYGPSAAAFFCTVILSGRRGVAELLRKIVVWRVRARWYALALFGAWFIGLIALTLSALFGTADFSFAGRPPALLFPLFLAWVIIFGGPLGEEFGWRGFALPRLMDSHGPYLASLILGLIWSLWHIPLFFISGTTQHDLAFIPYTLMTIPLTFIYTWIYCRSRGSLLLAILFHGASNAAAGFVPFMPVPQSGGTEATFGIFIALVWLFAGMVVLTTRNSRMGYLTWRESLLINNSCL